MRGISLGNNYVGNNNNYVGNKFRQFLGNTGNSVHEECCLHTLNRQEKKPGFHH